MQSSASPVSYIVILRAFWWRRRLLWALILHLKMPSFQPACCLTEVKPLSFVPGGLARATAMNGYLLVGQCDAFRSKALQVFTGSCLDCTLLAHPYSLNQAAVMSIHSRITGCVWGAKPSLVPGRRQPSGQLGTEQSEWMKHHHQHMLVQENRVMERRLGQGGARKEKNYKQKTSHANPWIHC